MKKNSQEKDTQLRKAYNFFILALCLSCGKGKLEKPVFYTVDKELKPYLSEYLETKGASLSQPIGMGFLDLPYSDKTEGRKIIGLCNTYFNGKKDIHFDREFWYNASEDAREMLFYHEMGHCDLTLKHDNRLDDSGMPVSIMFPSLFYWGDLGDEYKEKLFY